MSATTRDIPASSPSVDGQNKSSKPKPPSKCLPNNRVSLAKQMEILRAYAAISTSIEDQCRPVSNAEVGKMVGLQPGTVSIANSFLVSIGLLKRADGGYVPGSDAISFLKAHKWEPKTATHKLAPTIGISWFNRALMATLRFKEMDVQEAIAALGETANAGPEYKVQLGLLIDYLELANIVVRRGNKLSLAPPDHWPKDGDSCQTQQTPDCETSQSSTENPHQDGKTPSNNGLATAFTKTGDGGISFNINVQVDMREISSWSPERIAAFFNGVAAVLAAKGATEIKESVS